MKKLLLAFIPLFLLSCGTVQKVEQKPVEHIPVVKESIDDYLGVTSYFVENVKTMTNIFDDNRNEPLYDITLSLDKTISKNKEVTYMLSSYSLFETIYKNHTIAFFTNSDNTLEIKSFYADSSYDGRRMSESHRFKLSSNDVQKLKSLLEAEKTYVTLLGDIARTESVLITEDVKQDLFAILNLE